MVNPWIYLRKHGPYAKSNVEPVLSKCNDYFDRETKQQRQTPNEDELKHNITI